MFLNKNNFYTDEDCILRFVIKNNFKLKNYLAQAILDMGLFVFIFSLFAYIVYSIPKLFFVIIFIGIIRFLDQIRTFYRYYLYHIESIEVEGNKVEIILRNIINSSSSEILSDRGIVTAEIKKNNYWINNEREIFLIRIKNKIIRQPIDDKYWSRKKVDEIIKYFVNG